MKTLCVAVVVLSFTSVCQSAPLTCEQLLKPLDQSPNLSGRWYIIALSSSYCIFPVFLNDFLQPSVAVDLTAQATPKVYTANYTFHIYEYCSSLVKPFSLVNCSHCDVDSNHAHGPNTLLYTSCPDCLVVKAKNNIYMSLLFSRRENVTDAELKEFGAQTQCLGWVKPEVLNTDHESGNCKWKTVTELENLLPLSTKLVQKNESPQTVPASLHCSDQDASNEAPAGMEWLHQAFTSFGGAYGGRAKS